MTWQRVCALWRCLKLIRPIKIQSGSSPGFTLVEQLIGGAILSIVFSALFMALNFAANLTQTTQQDLRANQILIDKMEILRLYTWQQITNGTSIPLSFTNVYNPGNTNSSVSYMGTITIAPPPFTNNYAAALRLITVQVQWLSGAVWRSRQEYTLVSSNGLQAYVY